MPIVRAHVNFGLSGAALFIFPAFYMNEEDVLRWYESFATLPKPKRRRAALRLEAATRFASIRMGDSLIPMVLYRDRDGSSLAVYIY